MSYACGRKSSRAPPSCPPCPGHGCRVNRPSTAPAGTQVCRGGAAHPQQNCPATRLPHRAWVRLRLVLHCLCSAPWPCCELPPSSPWQAEPPWSLAWSPCQLGSHPSALCFIEYCFKLFILKELFLCCAIPPTPLGLGEPCVRLRLAVWAYVLRSGNGLAWCYRHLAQGFVSGVTWAGE